MNTCCRRSQEKQIFPGVCDFLGVYFFLVCNFLAILRGEEMLTDESQILEDFGDGGLRSRDHSECAHFGEQESETKTEE